MKKILQCVAAGLLITVLAVTAAAVTERFSLWADFGEEFPALPSGWVFNDANMDGYQWSPWDFGAARGGCGLRYLSNPAQPADDWVFSEALTLTSTDAYTLFFKVRVTSAGHPHKLAVWIGQTQNPADMTTMIYSNETLAYDTIHDETVSFSVGSNGTYYIGFRCYSDPGMFALFLDQVGLAVPESDLVVHLQMDKDIYEGSSTYTVGEPVKCMVILQNMGPSPITVNGKLTVGHEPDPDAVLSFLVTGPSGEVPFQMKCKPVEPAPGDFTTLDTADSVHKSYDLGFGFDFTTLGEYAIEAVYRNPYENDTGTAWRGRIVSTLVTITVE